MGQEKSGPWVFLAAALLHPLTALWARRSGRGAERIPATGSALLVLNHVSHLDPVYDAVFVHRRRRLPHFLAKQQLFRPFLLRQVMVGTGQIPVYRGSTEARDSLRAATTALAEGKVILIYPEGTITRDPDGWPMRARTGVARLALTSDVPVIPMARWGTLDMVDLYRRRFRLSRRGRVSTIVGGPVDLSEYRRKPVTNEVLREVTDLLMRRVTELLAEIRGESPPTTFYRPPTVPHQASPPDEKPIGAPAEPDVTG